MYQFTDVSIDEINLEEYYNFEDKLIFQTLPWINFIMKTQKVTPIILRICNDGDFVGYFTGFLFSKFGLKIVGSPFRGWTTLYMGFNLKQNVNRTSVIMPLWDYLKKEYHCVYFELIDRFITFEDAKRAGLKADSQETYVKDISHDINDVFKSFSSTCKNQINRFKRNNAVLKVREPDNIFAKEYYNQLLEVFGYQKLQPSYDITRVVSLLEEIKKMNGNLYCTEMCNPDGKSIGTLIGFAYNKTCYLWGLASIREEKYYQADYLIWDSFMHWKEFGCTSYDLVGVRDYKLKFHPELVSVPRIICSKSRILVAMRNIAQKIYWKMNSIKSSMR